MNTGRKMSIKDELISENDVAKLFSSVNTNDGGMVYILPEVSTSGKGDLINEYSPDLKKFAKTKNIPCSLIYDKDNYDYLSLRDSEILLPFIISLSAAACYDLLKPYIIRFFNEKKNLKVRLITKRKKESEYRKIVIKGDAEEVVRALEVLKGDENDGI